MEKYSRRKVNYVDAAFKAREAVQGDTE
jgi:hypothetical protein